VNTGETTGLREYSPEDFFNSNSYDGRVAFANGTVAMYVAGSWFGGTLKSEFPDIDGKWATAPLPQDKQCATTIAGDALAVFEQSKNKDAAWKWIEFLSAPQNMARHNLGAGEDLGASLLPPRKSLIEDPRAFERNEMLKGFAEMMQCGVTNFVDNENWGKVEELLNWLTDPNLAMPSIIIISLWQGVGGCMIIYLAGLQAIPDELYDAAKVDGAGPIRMLFSITIPLLGPATFFLLITSIIGAFQEFGRPYLMTSGGPAGRTTTIAYHLYTSASGTSRWATPRRCRTCCSL
jgi:hypothetical protein